MIRRNKKPTIRGQLVNIKYKPISAEVHLKRGYCCKNKCFHCPWNYKLLERMKTMADMNIKDKRATQLSGNTPASNSKQDSAHVAVIGKAARSYKVGSVTPDPTNVADHNRGNG